MVGGSVFYAAEARETNSDSKPEPEDAIEHLDKELQESEQRRLEAERLEQQLSSLVWICTSTQKMSKVTVIDANNPAEILDTFNVCESHLLCIASVPGAKESDYALTANDAISEDELSSGSGKEIDNQAEIALSEDNQNESRGASKAGADASPEEKVDQEASSSDPNATVEQKEASSEVDAETINLGKVRFVKIPAESSSSLVSTKEGVEEGEEEEKKDEDESETPIEKMSSIQPTMWLGAQNGAVFVHSAVAKWSVCLHTVKLQDAALAIV